MSASAPIAKPDRRQAMALAAGALSLAVVRPAKATPAAMAEALQAFTKGAAVQRGKVKLDIPLLVENGNAVPLKVSVDSPMTPQSHVKTVAVFSEKNPLPNVANFHLRPTGAPAVVQTRIRLGDSQTLTVVAQMSDGSFWSDSAELIVTLPACVEVPV